MKKLGIILILMLVPPCQIVAATDYLAMPGLGNVLSNPARDYRVEVNHDNVSIGIQISSLEMSVLAGDSRDVLGNVNRIAAFEDIRTQAFDHVCDDMALGACVIRPSTIPEPSLLAILGVGCMLFVRKNRLIRTY